MAGTDKLAKQLRRAVEASGLTGYELARRSGVHAGQISRFLRSESDLSLSSASALAEALKLELKPTAPRGRGRPAKSSEPVHTDECDESQE